MFHRHGSLRVLDSVLYLWLHRDWTVLDLLVRPRVPCVDSHLHLSFLVLLLPKDGTPFATSRTLQFGHDPHLNSTWSSTGVRENNKQTSWMTHGPWYLKYFMIKEIKSTLGYFIHTNKRSKRFIPLTPCLTRMYQIPSLVVSVGLVSHDSVWIEDYTFDLRLGWGWGYYQEGTLDQDLGRSKCRELRSDFHQDTVSRLWLD